MVVRSPYWDFKTLENVKKVEISKCTFVITVEIRDYIVNDSINTMLVTLNGLVLSVDL